MACKTFHKGKYYVTFKRGFEDTKKDLMVTIDKIFENDQLRISMSDDDDPTFLCILNVTRLDYEDLKKQQGLLIDFDNFPAQLVRLLQQCASNNMFMILHQTNPVQLYLEIVEHNEFKRLIHLSLKTGPATDADIKQHMANTINNLKKSLSAVKSSAANNEVLMSDKCMNMERKINDLTHAVTKLEDEKLKQGLDYQEILKQEREKFIQERLQWQKNLDMTSKTQNMTHQDIINKKDKQIDELNFLCKQAQDNIGQLEKQLSEKSQRLELLEKEVQKSHIEVATLNAKYSNLDREASEKDKLYKQLGSKCDYLEKTIKTNSDTIKDLNNLLTTAKKEKTSLEERLSLSESLASKNIESARSTSEQLLKANQIISKQSSELIEIKEKLLCRTAIALEQEKVIESNSKEIEELKLEVVNTKQSVGKLECELETLKEKCDHNEKMLTDRDDTIKNNNMVIQWLHKKLESSYGPIDNMQQKTGTNVQTASSSTPYFILSKHNQMNSSQPLSDESTVNFYATSKLSNIEDSPVPTTETRGNALNIGLNPKYLKPADDENDRTIKSSEKLKSAHSERSEGKENKNINLPRVDYREKKSGKSTYRATPVSAFFPR